MAQAQTFDDVLLLLWKISEGKIKPKDIVLGKECGSIPIRVQGVSWDKRIDARSAEFVQGLQKELNDFCKRYPEILGPDAPLLKVAIRDGSGILDPDYLPLLKEALKKMTGRQAAALIATLIISTSGYFAFDRYMTSQDNARIAQTAQVAIEAMRDVAVQKGMDTVKTERPFKRLTNSLGEFDQITVGGLITLPAAEAKKAVRIKQTRTAEMIAPCDGIYHLEKLDLTQPSPVLELSQGDATVKAYLEHLSPKDKKLLLDTIDKRIDNKKASLNLDLQMDIRFTGKTVKYGSVVGLGKPRAGMDHHMLSELPL